MGLSQKRCVWGGGGGGGGDCSCKISPFCLLSPSNTVKKEGHEVENRWEVEGQKKRKRNKGNGVNATREV